MVPDDAEALTDSVLQRVTIQPKREKESQRSIPWNCFANG